MNQINRTVATLFSFVLMTNANAFFCPKNFQQINIGDTIETVNSQCGKPDSIEKKAAGDNTPQEWNYYISQRGHSNNPGRQASIKTAFAFDKSGKLINITVNNVSTGSTPVCGSTVTVGDTRKQVESACGKPEFVNKQQQDNKQPAANNPGKEDDSNKIIEYHYNSTPPATLIFEKGRLIKKQ